MNRSIRTAVLCGAALMPAAALAQAVEVDRLTQAQLLEKATQLESTAATNNGSAGVTLSKYPNHFTMLSLRKTNGGAEIHRRFADIFYVVRGQATLTTGGTISDPKEVSEGEVRGTAVKGGLQIPLQQGDFVHIPAGVPHQIVLPAGEELVYFVIKVQEN